MDVLILSEVETLYSSKYDWKQEVEYHYVQKVSLTFCVLLLSENMNIFCALNRVGGLHSDVISSQASAASSRRDVSVSEPGGRPQSALRRLPGYSHLQTQPRLTLSSTDAAAAVEIACVFPRSPGSTLLTKMNAPPPQRGGSAR